MNSMVAEDLQYKIIFETVKLPTLPNQASFHVFWKKLKRPYKEICHCDCYLFSPVLIKIYTVTLEYTTY